MKKKKLSGEAKAGIGSVIGAAILIGVLAMYGKWSSKDRDENGPAVIERSAWVTLADGMAAVLLSESMAHGDEHSDWNVWRISLVSVDGALRSRRVVEKDPIACAPAGRGRAWCDFGKGIELIDLPAFKSIALPSSLDGHGDERIARDGGTLQVTTKDGYRVLVDPTSLQQKKLEVGARDDLENFVALRASQNATSPDAKLAGVTLVFEGGPRARVAVQSEGVARGATPIGELSFIKPRFVYDDEAKEAVIVADGKAVVVASSTSLDDKGAKVLLTAVTREGEKVWEVEEKLGTLLAARVFDRTLMVVLSHYAYVVLGIEQATGRVLYRYDGIRGKK